MRGQTDKDFDYNQAQHEVIETYFLADIANALKQYGDSFSLNIPDAVYSDLAWGGLDFGDNLELTPTEKQRIQSRLVAELLNEQFRTEQPVGMSMMN